MLSDTTSKIQAPQVATKIRDACQEEGLLIGRGGVFGNVLRIQPPLVISQSQMHDVVEIIDLAIGRV